MTIHNKASQALTWQAGDSTTECQQHLTAAGADRSRIRLVVCSGRQQQVKPRPVATAKQTEFEQFTFCCGRFWLVETSPHRPVRVFRSHRLAPLRHSRALSSFPRRREPRGDVAGGWHNAVLAQCLCNTRTPSISKRKPDLNGRPFAGGTMQADIGVHGLAQVLHNGKPQSGAATLSVAISFNSIEAFEDPFLILF